MAYRYCFFAVALVAGACGSSESEESNENLQSGDAGADRAGPSGQTLEGPITEPGTPFLAGTNFDLAEVGYEQAEYFLSGTASAYVNVGELGDDGRWTAEPGTTAEYKTRIVVYRPIDAARFNGTVIVEWLNVSGGVDAAPDWTTGHTELIRKGYAWVGVSAQYAGIEGGGGLVMLEGVPDTSLKGFAPDRYSSLHHPGDSYSYDIYSQVGELLRDPADPDPLGGLVPEAIIAVGESQSAFRLVTYVDAIDPVARVYDGFLIHSRGGGGAPLSKEPEPSIPVSVAPIIRDDVRVPVLTFQTETDLVSLGSLGSRQPDSASFRLWEVAGTAHADTYTLFVGSTDRGNDPSVANIMISSAPIPGIIECSTPVNSGPQHFVLKAAIFALNEWVRAGTEPPTAPLLEVTADGRQFQLDAQGNALGGIRTPYVDAATAVLSGLGQSGSGFCGIFGTTVLFDAATLSALYPTHDAYVAAVTQSTNDAVAAGFLLEPDGQLIIQAAQASDIGN